jgi:hypothetical protein
VGLHLVPAKQPDRQHRHERARQQVRRDHRERDRQGERREQRATDADHEQRRDEHRDDAEHREEARHHHFAHRLDDRTVRGLLAGEVRVNVLDRDRRFIDEDADPEREAAERHHVDRLSEQP